MAKIGFFETNAWEETFLKERLPNHDLYFTPKPLSETNLPSKENFDIVSIFTDSQINQKVINAFPNLKLIATRTTGVDHINQESLQSRNILLKNVPNYGAATVAEYTFALLLNFSRKISSSLQQLDDSKQFSRQDLQGFDLNGKTLGVIGTGNIGRNVIKIAKSFNMKILAHDIYPNLDFEKEVGFKYVSLDELLQNSDIISLHTPYLPQTHHLINVSNLKFIKKGAILINTARGAIVETQALIKALQENIFSAALLDVLEDETELKKAEEEARVNKIDKDNEKTFLENKTLMGMENVFITPHNAFNTREALERILNETVSSINEFTKEIA